MLIVADGAPRTGQSDRALLARLGPPALLPQLRALAARREPPDRAATVLRWAVVLELAFAVIVLGVTSVLVATEPAATGS